MEIRPFRISVADESLFDLRRRLEQTRWPSTIEGVGWRQGMDFDYLQLLVAYWRESFDWRATEALLNAFPQFEARVGTDTIHFVHLKGSGPRPLPIVLTHGWPSTFAELLHLGEILANPSEHGAASSDSFDVVIPSLPGYAFSSAPTRTGTNLFAIADRWADLMSALGYSRFIAQGGDLGAGVSTALGLRHPDRMLGLHLNYIPGSYRPFLRNGDALTDQEKDYQVHQAGWFDREGGYSHVQATKPDVLAAGLNDSPVGLAAWIVDKFRSWSDSGNDVESRFSRDDLLTNISLYWFTRSMPSAIRLYWEGRQRPLAFAEHDRVNAPVAFAHFPHEIPVPPRSYIERGYNIVRWTDMARGGHFAALEAPRELARDIRDFAQALRPRSPEAEAMK